MVSIFLLFFGHFYFLFIYLVIYTIIFLFIYLFIYFNTSFRKYMFVRTEILGIFKSPQR